MFNKTSRRMAQLLAAVVASGTLVVGGASAAHAAPCSPWPSCGGGEGWFHPQTPDNSLAEWTGNPNAGASIVGYLTNSQNVWVFCQANNGPTEDGMLSHTWDFVWSPAANRNVWVYDYWMTTPPIHSDGYSYDSQGHRYPTCNF